LLTYSGITCIIVSMLPSDSVGEESTVLIVTATMTTRFRYHGYSLLLSSPMQDETEEFLQRLRTPSVGSDSPPPGLSCIWASPARYLWHYFHFWPLVQTSGRGPTIGSLWSSSSPPSLGRGRIASPAWSWLRYIGPTPSLVVVVLPDPFRGMGAWMLRLWIGKARCDNYICLVTSNKQQINW